MVELQRRLPEQTEPKKIAFNHHPKAPVLSVNREGLAADMKNVHAEGQARLRYALLKAKFEKDEATPDDCMHDIDENIEAYNRPNRKTTFSLTLLENSSGAILGIPKSKKRTKYLREAQKALKATIREYSGTVDARIAFILGEPTVPPRARLTAFGLAPLPLFRSDWRSQILAHQ